MKIIRLKHPEKPFPAVPCGLCLGNFDGVHQGHRALIRELKQKNTELQTHLPLGALLFTEPPAVALGLPAVPQITTMEEKLHLLYEAGLEFAILYDFNEIKDLSPEEFVRDVLLTECQCKIAVCGFNYSFGKGGKGTADDLKHLLSAHGSTVSVVEAVTDGIHTVSSSLIRRLLESGHPQDAMRMLGHPFTLTGKVQRGKHVGRTMGYPTANLYFPKGCLIPAYGVYAVHVRIGNYTHEGITNIGVRPTFADGDQVTCETYLLNYDGDLYRKTLRVSFLRYLREERQFESVEELTAQIEQDLQHAQMYFKEI